MEETFETLEQWVEIAGLAIDVFGVLTIIGGLSWAIIRFIPQRLRHPHADHYRPFKNRIGRFLLLGLEILVAADIIRTIALEPNFTSVGVLAVLVLIRTFLSWTLVLEIEGRWPWQPANPGAEVDLDEMSKR
jgi:uncharacterized membrane protein